MLVQNPQDRQFARIALSWKMVTEADVEKAFRYQKHAPEKSIAEVLLEEGLLTKLQMQRILDSTEFQAIVTPTLAPPQKEPEKLDENFAAVLSEAPANDKDSETLPPKKESASMTMRMISDFLKQKTPIPQMISKERFSLSGMAKDLEIRVPKERKDKLCGCKVENYLLLRFLAKDAVSVTYKAQHGKDGRTALLQVIYEQYSQNQAYRQRFTQKKDSSTANIRHRHILQCYDCGEFQNRFYIAWKFFHAEQLSSISKRKKKIPQHIALQIVTDITKAIVEIYTQRAVHGNINLQNIVITDRGMAKLADWAWLYPPEQMLSPYCTAPEQIQTPYLADYRVDIYALGICFYQMLTGSIPFYHKDRNIILQKIVQEQLPPISQYADTISPYLVDIVDKMVQKKPEKRYQNPIELLQDLVKAQEKINVPIAVPKFAKRQPVVPQNKDEVSKLEQRPIKTSQVQTTSRKINPAIAIILALIAATMLINTLGIFDKKSDVTRNKVRKRPRRRAPDLKPQKIVRYQKLQVAVKVAMDSNDLDKCLHTLKHLQQFCKIYANSDEAQELQVHIPNLEQKIVYSKALIQYHNYQPKIYSLIKQNKFAKAEKLAKQKHESCNFEDIKNKWQILRTKLREAAAKKARLSLQKSEALVEQQQLQQAIEVLQHACTKQLPLHIATLRKQKEKIHNQLVSTRKLCWACKIQRSLYPLLAERKFNTARENLDKSKIYSNTTYFQSQLKKFYQEIAMIEKLDQQLLAALNGELRKKYFRFIFEHEKPFIGIVDMVSIKRRHIVIRKKAQGVVSRPIARLSWKSKKKIWQLCLGKDMETLSSILLLAIIQNKFDTVIDELPKISDLNFRNRMHEKLVSSLASYMLNCSKINKPKKLQRLLKKYRKTYSASKNWSLLQNTLADAFYEQGKYNEHKHNKKQALRFYSLTAIYFAATTSGKQAKKKIY